MPQRSLLRSQAFESKYGWLCARYRQECYWWEIAYLEVRFVSIAIDAFLPSFVAGCVIIGITANQAPSRSPPP